MRISFEHITWVHLTNLKLGEDSVRCLYILLCAWSSIFRIRLDRFGVVNCIKLYPDRIMHSLLWLTFHAVTFHLKKIRKTLWIYQYVKHLVSQFWPSSNCLIELKQLRWQYNNCKWWQHKQKWIVELFKSY